MRLNRKTKRKVRTICNGHKKSYRDFYDYFFIKVNDSYLRPKGVTRNYKELKRLGEEHAKNIKPIPMSENVAADVYTFTVNHDLYKLNRKLEAEFNQDLTKYAYNITKHKSLKINLDYIKKRRNGI
jgi:hypothetical protein